MRYERRKKRWAKWVGKVSVYIRRFDPDTPLVCALYNYIKIAWTILYNVHKSFKIHFFLTYSAYIT